MSLLTEYMGDTRGSEVFIICDVAAVHGLSPKGLVLGETLPVSRALGIWAAGFLFTTICEIYECRYTITVAIVWVIFEELEHIPKNVKDLLLSVYIFSICDTHCHILEELLSA